ncbi:HNH endonuclease [Dyadobacter soli]|uniref:HNH endonuclease n=1 Tax=Dyadobacter soli TaxID=659014 RepID=A0A1G7T443_9BACT|nr:HNH endonuclease [Dyadobacter soli]
MEVINESNSSVEYVIPNDVGGRLKSSALLCKSCNSLYGGGIDAVFAHATEPITALLNIKRERKKENILKN